MMDKYTKGYLSYIEETKDIDMSEQYKLFMKYVPKGSLILDAGFGSGRDIAFFKQHYEVIGIDISKEFVEYVKENIHKDVFIMNILNLKLEDTFDAIWASASLVHLDYADTIKAILMFTETLSESGIIYLSLKRSGELILIDDQLYTISNFIKDISKNFILEELSSSTSSYKNQEWYSFILRVNK